jgi:Nuclease-related domain
VDYNRALFIYGMLLVSVLGAAIWVGCVTYVRKVRKERSPLSEPTLQPPGYSLRLQIEKLDEELSFWIVALLGAPMLETAFFFATIKEPSLWAIVPSVIGTIVLALWQVSSKISKIRSYRLGFAGELFVASFLDELREAGYKILHDFALPNQGNIDHIAVGPGGVFAIETKTRRKKKSETKQRDQDVIFDGKLLRFPNGSAVDGLDQCKRQAEVLSRWLYRRLRRKQFVVPVLTIPGWFVRATTKCDLQVINPKQLREVINQKKGSLSRSEIDEIAVIIDEKCRDVMF